MRNTTAAVISGLSLVAATVVATTVVVRQHRAGQTAAATGAMETGQGGPDVVSGGAVTLTPAQLQRFGVTFGVAAVRPLTWQTRTAGVVTFDETKMAQVAPKVGGFVERLYVNATGQHVRRGEPMLEIYSPELVAAQQELLLAAQLDRSMGQSGVPGVPAGHTDLADASKRRLRLWDISEAQIDDILRAGQVRRTLTLYAPVSGVVVDKTVLQGQSITPGTTLYTIANLANVWIDAELREADAAAVRVGSTADIEVTGLPNGRYKGRVTYVYPLVQQEARTVRARIVVPNPSGVLKPGMYAIVRLATMGRFALTVPSSAILQTGDRNVVFVDVGDGQLVPHAVEVGSVAGDYTEVLSGLHAGDRVVTSAQFLLDSESNLGEVMKSMIGNRGAGDKATQDMPGMSMPPASAPPARSTPRR